MHLAFDARKDDLMFILGAVKSYAQISLQSLAE